MSCSSWSRDSTDLVNRGNYILRPVMIKVQIDQSSFHMDVSRCILFKAVLFRVNFKSTNYLRYIRSIIVAAMFSSKRLCQISLQTHIHSVCLCVRASNVQITFGAEALMMQHEALKMQQEDLNVFVSVFSLHTPVTRGIV